MKNRHHTPGFFEYHCQLMNLGFLPFFSDTQHSRFAAGRFSLRGRSYYLKHEVCPKDRSLWKSTVVFFYDPPPEVHPCVRTMINAANHHAMIKANQIVQMSKVFSVCS